MDTGPAWSPALDEGAGLKPMWRQQESGSRFRPRCSAKVPLRARPARELRRRDTRLDRGRTLTKEKKCFGFFISGHPLERFRGRGRSLRSRRPHQHLSASGASTRLVAFGVFTLVKRQISKKTGRNTPASPWRTSMAPRQAIVFRDAGPASTADSRGSAVVLTGGLYSARDRG